MRSGLCTYFHNYGVPVLATKDKYQKPNPIVRTFSSYN